MQRQYECSTTEGHNVRAGSEVQAVAPLLGGGVEQGVTGVGIILFILFIEYEGPDGVEMV
jgi:hypothetical protein